VGSVGLLDRFRPRRPFRPLKPAEADEATRTGSLLIDIRAQDEWDAGHAPVALHIPVRRLGERLPKLPKSSELILVCRTGSRARAQAELLAAKGVTVAYVNGGMRAWAKAGLPVVTTGDRPGTIT
jgi:rhodanese-related sulfurtransferase